MRIKGLNGVISKYNELKHYPGYGLALEVLLEKDLNLKVVKCVYASQEELNSIDLANKENFYGLFILAIGFYNPFLNVSIALIKQKIINILETNEYVKKRYKYARQQILNEREDK